MLQTTGRFREALDHYERALVLRPDHVHSLNNAGICQLHLGDPVAAESAFRRCVEVDPQNARMWVNLSASCAAQGRPDEALEAVRQAGTIAANRDEAPELFCQTAIYLSELGRTLEARELLERNLAQLPDPNAHYLYSHLLLLSGHLTEGWQQQEFRWMLEPLVSLRGRLHIPVWRGQDLRGRSILVRPEQGLGDTLQFIRYVPILKALGATVILQSWRGLTGVVEESQVHRCRRVAGGSPAAFRLLGSIAEHPRPPRK